MDLSLGGVKSFGKSLHARVASTAKSLEVKDTGNAKVDAMGDVINNALAPFSEAPDPKKGALGVVEQGINAVMGLQNAPMELMNTGFAMLTAPLAAMMPAFPAATLTAPHIGVPHAHTHPPSLIPPAPPVPLPSIGTVMAAGCVSVLIGGLPAARCGDLGLAPTCGSLAPAFDIFLGSSNTFIGGNRAARLSDVTRHCNPASKSMVVSRGAAIMSAAIAGVGAAASAAAGQMMQAAMQAAQIAADAAAAAMSALCGSDPGIPPAMGALMFGAPNVLIGGFPCPNLPNPLEMLMKGLKKLGKAIAASKAFGKLLNKVGLCNDPSEPIDTFTGEVYNDFIDFHASDGAFVWERHYRSGWNNQYGPLGYGYRHFYQRTLTLLRKRAIYETHDNEAVALERLPDGTFRTNSGFRLRGDGQRFELITDRDEILEFELVPGSTPASARLVRYRREKLDAALFYDPNGRLRALTEFSPGATIDTHLTYGPHGCIEEVQRGARGQQPQTISRYVYSDGCIVEWHDVMGAVARSRFDMTRRLVQDTDRRGYSFHWYYDPNSGRCIKSHGDDGLWAAEARYEGLQSTFIEPDGGEWTFKHYSDGTVSHIVDPRGGVTEYVTDDHGRIVVQRLPGGYEYQWLYDVDGKHTGRRDPFGYWCPPEDVEPNPPNPLGHNGPETQLEWLHGRPLLRGGLGRPQLGSGVLRSVQDARPANARGTPERAAIKDILGRVIEQSHADGSVERFQYDAEGNLVVHQGIKGNWRANDIVSWNKIGTQRSASGYQTQYGYSHRSRVTQIIDGNGNRTDYVRDKTQRITSIVVNGAPRVTYVRDVHGSVVDERDAQGKSLVKYQTNELGLHTSAKLAEGEQYTYAYDEFGNLTNASSSLHAVTLKYRGRCRTHDLRDGHGVEHSFRKGHLASTTVLDRFTVQYSAENGALRVKTPDGTEHTFWLMDRSTVVQKTGNGTYYATVFDSKDRLAARVCWREGSDITHWETRYVYNAAGELLHAIDSHSGPTRYDYDADSRLLVQHDPDGTQSHYRYDHANNLSYTPQHQHLAIATGNLLSHSHTERFEYDQYGRLARRERHEGRSVSYRYDSLGQLVEARFSDRADVWRAGYDGLGRRLWREYGGKRTDFYWDGDRLAAEVAPDGALRVYVYANEDSLCPFMWLDYPNLDADPASGSAYYVFCAPTGTPLRVENQIREIVWQAKRVDAYGAISVADDAQVDVRLRFAGHFCDEDTGLFYNRFRDYDPDLGRYLQPDPWGQAGGINLYAYPANPVVLVDLRGLAPHFKKGAVPMDKQNGSKHPTGEADDPAIKAKRAEELEPRKDLPRGEDGLITNEAAKAECERLAAKRREHMDEDMANCKTDAQRKALAEKQGPCVSVTMDRNTGETFHGHNDSRPAGKDVKTQMKEGSGKKAKNEGKPPDNLHPDLAPRVNDLNSNPRELTDDGRVMSNPGSHAEVHSTNAALQDRAEQNKTRPADNQLPEGKDAMPELTTVQQPRNVEPGRSTDMPCCPNCSYITHGSDQASGTSPKAGDPPED